MLEPGVKVQTIHASKGLQYRAVTLLWAGVRAIYFDKSPEANWLVPWHQDLTVALRSRREVPGFGPWSVKDGVPHVQPPVERLEQMLTVRLHLDDADEGNGALRVLPGSHRSGRLSSTQIQALRAGQADVLCAATRSAIAHCASTTFFQG